MSRAQATSTYFALALNPEEPPSFKHRCRAGRAASAERVEHEPIGWGGEPYQPAHQLKRLHGGMEVAHKPGRAALAGIELHRAERQVLAARLALSPRSLGAVEQPARPGAAGVEQAHGAVGAVGERDVGRPVPLRHGGAGDPGRVDVERAGAEAREVVDGRAVEGLTGEQDRLIRRFERRGKPAGQPPGLRDTLPVEPQNLVPHLQTGLLDSGHQPVEGARRPEGEKVPAGFEHPVALRCPCRVQCSNASPELSPSAPGARRMAVPSQAAIPIP